jgi:hypothetical protein
MTPEQFIARWHGNPLTERAGAQGHFDDLCDLLGVSDRETVEIHTAAAQSERPPEQ